MINNLSATSKDIILELYTKEGVLPQNWNKSVLVPIAKPGKDHYKTENYRPIAYVEYMQIDGINDK